MAQTPTGALRVSASTVPAEARQDGPPLREADSVLFRFHAPEDTAKVFLAGSFNSYANNQNGAVTDDQFALKTAGDGYYFTRVLVEPKVGQYKFVVLDKAGQFSWVADPQVRQTDQDGNSVVDFSKIERLPGSVVREGAPLRDGEEVLFRFRAPFNAVKVYLAGTFNGFGNPQDGKISDEAFAMTPGKDGLYSKRVPVSATTERYKYVVMDKAGQFNWISDPFIKATDQDGNTVLDFSRLDRVP